jgi:hypothetical protein
MVVVDQIEVEDEEKDEVVEDLVVDRLVQENLLVLMMFATNVEVNCFIRIILKNLID